MVKNKEMFLTSFRTELIKLKTRKIIFQKKSKFKKNSKKKIFM